MKKSLSYRFFLLARCARRASRALLEAELIERLKPQLNGLPPAVSDVWVVPADGTGQPELLMREAASPTVLHRVARTVETR